MAQRFSETLKNHTGLSARHSASQQRATQLRQALRGDSVLSNPDLMIYCAGSVARAEIGSKSDLDLFLISTNEEAANNNETAKTLYARASQYGEAQGFPKIITGRYTLIYSAKDLQQKTGTPQDDAENLFTARMLLLLESSFITNESLYLEQIKSVLGNYFRDSDGNRSFRPLFLLNDILRYWRTLCLNYEQIRLDKSRPWGKKNVNLKFARMLTVFGTVLPLISKPMSTVDDVRLLCNMRPLERFAHGLDLLDAPNLHKRFTGFLDTYEDFLTWKESDEVDDFLQNSETKKKVRKAADNFSAYIYDAVTHNSIQKEYRKFLVI